MIFNTLRQLDRHRQEVFVVLPSALESLDDFLEVFLERDADLLAQICQVKYCVYHTDNQSVMLITFNDLTCSLMQLISAIIQLF